ncbi:U-box domain-containing protein 11-like [Euphorbia lathyris]|uniref:U-box domain-containing protein 11-like n=1 Tax=Euphorbia lathyris TaxID=212925 RepID=UPI0033138942
MQKPMEIAITTIQVLVKDTMIQRDKREEELRGQIEENKLKISEAENEITNGKIKELSAQIEEHKLRIWEADNAVTIAKEKEELLEAELKETKEEVDALRDLNQLLINKEVKANNELQDARKKLIDMMKEISKWFAQNHIEQAAGLANGRIKRSDGSFRDVNGDVAAIQPLVRKLSSRCKEECRDVVSEIRLLSKRSTYNKILIAGTGAIPVLVDLLTFEDVSIQENSVTAILNLSIYESNKAMIMLAGAIPSIVQILRAGSAEARENAAATLFSLSFGDENKIIIGEFGAIPALVKLLENGGPRGKKDAAAALFNLCIYQGNKGRAVRAGIIPALQKMLTDVRNCMANEALTILSVLASIQDAKVAIVKASTIPVLIDLLRTSQPVNKENATAILLSLCKKDPENLVCISRLGAVIPLMELAKSGTERAKRKATLLLEHLQKV